jgi:hypothetical protein
VSLSREILRIIKKDPSVIAHIPNISSSIDQRTIDYYTSSIEMIDIKNVLLDFLW